MAERKTYKEIVRKFLENDEVVIETRLDGERAGEKKILTSEEAKKSSKRWMASGDSVCKTKSGAFRRRTRFACDCTIIKDGRVSCNCGR